MPRTFALLIAATGVTLAAWWWWPAQVDPTRPRTAAATVENIGTAAAAPSENTVAIPVYVAASGALPPPDAPLSQSFGSLREAARAGNPTAACRLAFALRHCQSIMARRELQRVSLRFLDGLLPADPALEAPVASLVADRLAEFPEYLRGEASAKLDVEMSNSMVNLGEDLHAADLAFCEAAPEAPAREIRGWLRQAALAGESASMSEYASGSLWRMELQARSARNDRGKPLLDDPEFRQWMVEAPRVLEAAIARGEPAAVMLALRAHRTPSMLAAALPLNERRDAVLGVIALRLAGRDGWVSTADFGLPAADVPAADAEARTLFNAAFAGRTGGLWRDASMQIGRGRDADGRFIRAACES